jgi:DNA-binding CsgD family transcriptional regulator
VDCVKALIARGNGTSQLAQVRFQGQRHLLSCVAVNDTVVSTCIPLASAGPHWMRLTAREREVLVLVAEGMTTRKVAEQLELTEATVRAHLEHMRVRLGLPTRAALVAASIRLGLID